MCLICFEPRPTVTVLHSKKECIYQKFFLGNSKFPLKSKPTITLDVQTKQLNYFRIAYRRYAIIEVTLAVFWVIYLLRHPPPKNHPSHHLTDPHTSPLKLCPVTDFQVFLCFWQIIFTESTRQAFGRLFAFLVHFNHCNTPRSISEIYSTIG